MRWYSLDWNRLMGLTAFAACAALMGSMFFRSFMQDGWTGLTQAVLITACTWTILGLTFKVASLMGERDELKRQRDKYFNEVHARSFGKDVL